MTMLKLICATIGKEEIFVVDIDHRQVVAELKEEIRLMACVLEGLVSRQFHLFLAKHHGQRDNPWLELNDELAQIQQFAVSKAVKATYMKKALLLNPLRQVGGYFPDLPESGVVHVLVRFPHNTYTSLTSVLLAFTPSLAADPRWKDKLFQESRQRGVSAMDFKALPNMLRSVECLDSPGADDLASRQKMAVAREFQTKLATGEKLLSPAWLLDKYFTGVPSRYCSLNLVTIYPPSRHVRRVKIDLVPSNQPNDTKPSSGPWLVSRWRGPHRWVPRTSKTHLFASFPSSKP